MGIEGDTRVSVKVHFDWLCMRAIVRPQCIDDRICHLRPINDLYYEIF